MLGRRINRSYIVLMAILCVWPFVVSAEDVYQTPEDFIAESFDGSPPEPSILWITKSLRPTINEIMQRDVNMLRVRYWKQGERTVWILDEIGKVKPITTGIVVNNDVIERLKVLVYRETHGWEVRHRFFTDQFDNAKLTPDLTLTETIDNISGATLSVNALRNLGELALFLHKQVS